MAEAETNLAINVIPGLSESFEVQGRGELQLGMPLLTCNHLVSSYNYQFQKVDKLIHFVRQLCLNIRWL